MKTLKKIKLNGLNDAELRDREMDALNGGDRTIGSANYKLGTSGGHSISGTPVVCFTDEFGNGIQGAVDNW